MNNLKIVYKKPTEYDNSTISISSYDYNTESDYDDKKYNQQLSDQNIESINTSTNTTTNITTNITTNTPTNTSNIPNKSLNQEDSLNTNQDADNYVDNTDDQFDHVVTLLKNNIINYKNKEEIIKYIDNFFTINNFSERDKNIILLKLNELIIKPVKLNYTDRIDKENKNDIKKLDTSKTLSIDEDNLIYTDSKNSTKMFGLDINLWGILCIIIVLLFLYTRKKSG
jgi:hypothetical protein